jgi:cation diffusion facilitator CzcD-associated flavoprotein CzcO
MGVAVAVESGGVAAQRVSRPRSLEVGVVGAGPFGLSIASFLSDRSSRLFGQPMQTWREVIPSGMILRSTWEETSLASPDDRGSIDVWAKEVGEQQRQDLPVELFLRYAEWFRERCVRHLDPSTVTRIEAHENGGYRLETSGGAEFLARRVVIAVGALPFASAPDALAHSIDGEQVRFAVSRPEAVEGKRIVVVGAGQTALETAAVLRREGASVELIARSPVHWFADRKPHAVRGPLQERLYQLAYPVIGFGPPPINRFARHPDLFALLPSRLRDRITKRMLRAGGSPWLRNEVEGKIAMSEGRQVIEITRDRAQVRLTLDDGTTREADRVLFATGFRFDLQRLPFLSAELAAQIDVRNGWPTLDRYFRSVSEPGITFLGYPAEGRFGPTSRFVVGTQFTSPRAYQGLAAPPAAV